MALESPNGYDGPLYYRGTNSGPYSFDGFHRVLVDDSIVPAVAASWAEELSVFALSFNGCEAFGGHDEPSVLSRISVREWNATGELPADLSLAQLRGILYHERRFYGHQGESPQPV
jgi:hypothetical protein